MTIPFHCNTRSPFRRLNLWAMVAIGLLVVGCDGQQQIQPGAAGLKAQLMETTKRFHEVIRTGSLDDLRQAVDAGADVNAPGKHDETALMVALEIEDLEKVKLLVERGADLEKTDQFNHTPLRHAVYQDFAAGVQYLLSLGAERGYQPKYPLKKIDYSFGRLQVPMPEELKPVMSEAEWQASMQETQQMLAEMNENPTVQPVIADAESVAVLKLLLAAGDEFRAAPREIQREFVGLKNGGDFTATPSDFQQFKHRRFGMKNPDSMDNPYWQDMVRIGCNAYEARQHFGDRDPFNGAGAIWCFDRFGSSVTPLPDGRFVQIAGEHEDFYDPDFMIYNDVVVHDGKGDFKIFGYPEHLFPPTDSHTATLVGDWIYIIGCLGYPEQRQTGRTPVYRLHADSWRIEAVATSGEPPSWLHSHRARYVAERNVLVIEGGDIQVTGSDGQPKITKNDDRFELDLASLRWRRL